MVSNNVMSLTPHLITHPDMDLGFGPWLCILGRTEFGATAPLGTGFGRALKWAMERALGLYLG